jgi:hypothetical protein
MPAVVVDTLDLAGAADGAALGAAVAFAGLIPPCPEQAPRPALLVDPSAHVTALVDFFAAVALAVAWARTASGVTRLIAAATTANEQRVRMDMNPPE